MEESEDPDQPISAWRQEVRKRRRPSQPTVDKSQQTDIKEEKKHMAMPQSSSPKATHSIANIAASKGNYPANAYESLRISSELRQTRTKRKHGQEMTGKSLQTDIIVEEKKEVKLVEETVVPEEKSADVREAGIELPESVQEVEIPPNIPSVQLKMDRSQQTNCTGDWTMMNIPHVEKVDKEQQTFFNESEIVVISRPHSSSITSKEGALKHKSSGKIFVSEHPEFQPATSRTEEIRQKSISRTSFTQETKNSPPVLLEDELKQEVTIPVVQEGSAAEKVAPAIIEPPPTETFPAEIQPSLVEESTAEAEPRTTENIYVQVEPPTEETPAAEAATAVAKNSVKVQPPPAKEASLVEFPAEIQPPPAEKSHSVELPSKIWSPSSEKAPTEVWPLPAEGALEEAPAKLEPTTAEEALAEGQPQLLEEAPREKAQEHQLSTAMENPAEEAPDEFQSPSAEETTAEEASAAIQLLAAIEAPAEELPAEVQFPPAEETPAEVQPPSAEETPAEETLAEVHSPAADEVPAEEVPVDEHSPPADLLLTEEFPIQEVSAEGSPPPSEQTPENEALVANMSTGLQSPQVAGIPAVVSEDDAKFEEVLKTNPVHKDLSNTNDGQVPILEIEGVFHIEFKKPS
ncbi:fibrous sheath CABYR-binding protein [Aotus nancymaae]|uniref:fibrous sheath CABYR-binding protein n=1 Tax=Aotus nancymaae TaxID=37293 RepID=UPI0030FE760D